MVCNGYDRCPNFKIKKMKKLFFFTMLCAFSLAGFSQEKNVDDKKNIVKANLGGILLGTGYVAYERAISPKSSLQVAIGGGAFVLPLFDFYSYSFFGGGAEYRYYFTGKALDGTYFAPGVAFMSGVSDYKSYPLFGVPTTTTTTSGSGSMISLVIGHQWVFDNHWSIDVNGGIANWNINWKNETSFWDNPIYSDKNEKPLNGILPQVAFSLGYNF
jgi:hypothetical protein